MAYVTLSCECMVKKVGCDVHLDGVEVVHGLLWWCKGLGGSVAGSRCVRGASFGVAACRTITTEASWARKEH